MRRVELNGRKSEVQGRQVGRTETRSMKKLEGGRGRQEESGRRKREREVVRAKRVRSRLTGDGGGRESSSECKSDTYRAVSCSERAASCAIGWKSYGVYVFCYRGLPG